jgi:ABC-type multidrug transport system permease subunit/archaellum component FlaC
MKLRKYLSITGMIKKDISLIFKRRSSTFLILLTPLVVMIIAGMTFIELGEEKAGGVHILVCDEDGSSLSYDFSVSLERVFYMSYAFEGCDFDPINYVKAGYLKVVLVIPNGFEENILSGKSTNLELILDNTDTAVSTLSNTIVLAAVHELSQAVGKEFISSAWGELDTLRIQIEEAKGGISSSKRDLQDLKQDLIELRTTFNEFNITKYIELVDKGIDTSNTALDYTDTILYGSEEYSLPVMKNKVQEARSNLIQIRSDLIALSSNGTIIDISPLDSLITTTTEIESGITSVEENITEIRNSITDLRESLIEIKIELARLNEQVENFTTKLDNAILLIDDYSEKLNQAEIASDTAVTSLGQLTSTEPETILSPAHLSLSTPFETKGGILPAIPLLVCIVLMLVTLLLASTSLVKERSSGTLTRSLISPIPSIYVILSKMISVIIIGLFEGVIILFFAEPFFGIILRDGMFFPYLYSIFLISTSFCAIGLVIASFAKSEIVAVLCSLIVAIPMLFLSGIFTPLEFMDPIIRENAIGLPLTVGILVVRRILIYETVDIFTMPIIRNGESTLLGVGGVFFRYIFLGTLASYVILTDKLPRKKFSWIFKRKTLAFLFVFIFIDVYLAILIFGGHYLYKKFKKRFFKKE